METNELFYKKKLNSSLKKHKPESMVLEDPKNNITQLIQNPGLFISDQTDDKIQQFVEKMPYPQVIQIENMVNNVLHVQYINKVNTA